MKIWKHLRRRSYIRREAMFIDFFYTLKAKGLDISMTEWLTFMEALDKGLVDSNFSQFYYVSRMILVKYESD